MAHIPLMSEQDLEEGDLPTYEDTQNQKNNDQHYFPASKTVEHEAAVAHASKQIRLGFLRKVFGILSFQFLATFVFCFVLYLTPGVRGFVQQQ
uniref:Uncharacterized protein n=1 Tax=Panagrolaimus sp. PS1159 TaxID=55785 RepID=A0AC35GAI7_9BILA